MSKLTASRGSQIDTEKCVNDSGGNRFDLVIQASARAKQIKRLNNSSMRQEHIGACVSALLEIQEGKHK